MVMRDTASNDTVDRTRRTRDDATELADVVVRIAGGDVDSFAELYDRTCAGVYGITLQVLRDAGFAEAVTEEIYLEVWRTAGKFDPSRGSVLSWLIDMTYARAIERARLERSRTDRGSHSQLMTGPP
ncbi:sigma factor [Antrihabitans stalactiti]|nr:sigma factor [Antrihabitans stalactiti]